jgi:uncharacterized radical SAM superfamily protein
MKQCKPYPSYQKASNNAKNASKSIKQEINLSYEREMTVLTPEYIWKLNEQQLLDVLNKDLFSNKRRRIHFYAPSFMYYSVKHHHTSLTDFPTISITGSHCGVKCKHCRGIVLDTMHPVGTPSELFELCRRLKEKDALGCLISGGCAPDGSVPLGKYFDAISQVTGELDLTVFVHSGIVNHDMVKALKKAGVDAVLIDIIGSDETIGEIYGLSITTEDYRNSLKALHNADVTFVPHVIVGLHYGKLMGELNALKMISDFAPSALVVIAFMPIHGTQMEQVVPPKPLDMAKVIAVARTMLPQTPIVLGCMRPKGTLRAETEILAVKAGVDGIAFPTKKTVEFAQNHSYETAFSSFCCSQIYVDASV